MEPIPQSTEALPRIVKRKRKDEPIFDSSQGALRFAFNYKKPSYAPPLMARIAQDLKLAKGPPKEEERGLVANARRRPLAPVLRGLDKPAQAGMILVHFARLSPVQQDVLICASLPSRLSCDCKAACCCGFKPNYEWKLAADRLAEAIFRDAQLVRRGKKGFSTHPLVRTGMIDKYFNKKRRISMPELAERVGISLRTLVAHKAAIDAFLTRHEKDAWTALDYGLTHAGIVGDLQLA